MKIFLTKIITFITTLCTSLVYGFHKHIKGIKTIRNLKYKKKANFFNKLDVHYHKDDTSNPRPCIIYFHGGGWCGYSKSVFTTLTRRLADMGYVVFNVNYSLAPKYKMEQILCDAVNALEYVRKNAEKYNADSNNITLAGDSAGAHIISMITALLYSGEIKNHEIKNSIKSLILLYGVYNLKTAYSSGFPNIKTYLSACLKGKGKDQDENDEFSPVHYITNDFPPCFLASGEIDKLHETQSKEMAKVLQSKQVITKTLFFKKDETRAMHAYMVFDDLETSKITLKSIEKFLEEIYKK